MSVYRPADRRSYVYDFELFGRRYKGSTRQVRQDLAEAYEAELKRKIRERASGVVPVGPEDTPRFQDWAEIYLRHAQRTMKRPERVADLLRVVLRFCGGKPTGTNPKNQPVEGEPYHDLRLGDVVKDPGWLLQFEDWLTARGKAGQTNNQYRSVLSQMFALAADPRYRRRTGIVTNPLAGLARDRGRRKTATVTVEELRRWMAAASYHVRLAMAIAVLAPKLRLGSILGLRWGREVNAALTFITVSEHKTEDRIARPLVVPIVPQLRTIIEDARRRNRGEHVVAYRGRPLSTIRGAVGAGVARFFPCLVVRRLVPFIRCPRVSAIAFRGVPRPA